MKTHLNRSLFLPVLFGVIATLAAAETTNANLAASTEKALQHAMLASDPSGKKAAEEAAAIDALAKPLDEALAHSPNDPALLYTRAFAHFAASIPLRWANQSGGLGDRYDRAIALLEKIPDAAPWKAEAEAFEGFIVTQLIGVRGLDSAMDLWPKADRLLARAAKAQPQNPRVLFFRGHVLWTVPAQVGGNTEKGLALMQASTEAFAKLDAAGANDDGPHWGYPYALGWLGSALRKKGDKEGAATAWKLTLTLEPNYTFVEKRLLPSLQKKDTKPGKPEAKSASTAAAT